MKSLRLAALVALAPLVSSAIVSCAGASAGGGATPSSTSAAGDDGAPQEGTPDAASAAARIVLDTQLEVAQDELARARAEYKSARAGAEEAPDDAGVLERLDAASTQLDATAVAVATFTQAREQLVASEILDQAKDAGPPDPKKQEQIEFENGGRLRYGLSVSLLQISATRPDDEPGRTRNYATKIEAVPPELGFQFTYQPAGHPWRLKRRDGSHFQLMSWGGMVLAGVRNSNFAQGALRLGATINFFENVIGFGAGFDLYRGIPVLGPSGVAGGETAYTGLLAWALANQGEVTPENLFFVVTLGVDPIVKALTGEVR
ncbi:MAG: hypothetical protein KF782_04715 [Labilithrix sp.]|nr:hypothetical protein [Labilithrix sp.]